MAEYQAFTLRTINDQMGLKPLNQIALQPGVRAVYRLTVRYHDRRARDSAATMLRNGPDGASLEVVYRGLFEHKPVTLKVEQTAYDAFVGALQTMGFDHLPDQPDIPTHGVDLWLIERAAGGFYKSVVVAPELTGNVYAKLVYLLGKSLPEAVREVRE
ncbi:MAG: hypothetical protein K8L97_19945 [Anaerolineae bacterium]|nr:hypothetical protein [Anaerolineae bacterium]